MTTGKEINDTIKKFLKSVGATNESSGIAPDAIGQAVKSLLGHNEDENVDIGLAVFNLLRKYRNMKDAGTVGSVLTNAGRFWLNLSGGTDATTAYPIGVPTGFAAAGSRSVDLENMQPTPMPELPKGKRRKPAPTPDVEVLVFDEAPVIVESESQEPASPCCKLLASVIDLNAAGILDDVAFKQAVIKIALSCANDDN